MAYTVLKDCSQIVEYNKWKPPLPEDWEASLRSFIDTSQLLRRQLRVKDLTNVILHHMKEILGMCTLRLAVPIDSRTARLVISKSQQLKSRDHVHEWLLELMEAWSQTEPHSIQYYSTRTGVHART